jgi:hypothetical protein
MLRNVALVRTDVPEELSASFIRVTLMKEALSSSETSVLTRGTRRIIPEDTILHRHRRENLKSYTAFLLSGVSKLRLISLNLYQFSGTEIVFLHRCVQACNYEEEVRKHASSPNKQFVSHD